MKRILDYLREKYHPVSILLYGSYRDGTNDEYSDFDCMLIVKNRENRHDDSVIDGIPLDCFLFSVEETRSEDPDTFLTAYDADIVEDDGTGAALKDRVRAYVEAHSETDAEEKRFTASWIEKTMKRAGKNDDEGCFRAVAFLWESLTDYFLLRDMFYFGSKKAIVYLKNSDPEGYALFHKAITERSIGAIANWAAYVTKGID